MTSPVPLEGLYTRENMLSKPSAFTRVPKDQLLEMYLKESSFGKHTGKPQTGLDVFNQHDKLFILGKPGAGKTTFLKYIILQATTKELELIPICVELRRFADKDIPLIDYIVEQFDICGFPEAKPFIEAVLKSGKAAVLCDGLDEVNREGRARDKVIDQLADFSEKYNKSRFVITCRGAAVEYSFEKFTYVEMADFDEEQIKIFIGKWFVDDEKTHQRFIQEFQRTDNKRLRELANNPLLLTLLCLAFRKNLGFPSRRCEIYSDALDSLMREWDVSRKITRDEIYQNLSHGRKLNMLARIAAVNFEKGEYLIDQNKLQKQIIDYLRTLPQAEAPEDIDGEAVLKAVEAQHGVLVERTMKIHSFSHKTFQEYFTAKYIVDNAHRGTLKELIDDHILDDNWREVFLLTAETLDDADEFFSLFFCKLDEMALADEKLLWLLQEALKAEGGEEIEEIPAGKKKYFYIFFFLSFFFQSSFYNAFDRVFDRVFDSALALVHALAPAFDNLFDFDRDHDLTRALNRAFDFDNALTLARTLTFTLTMEKSFDSAYKLIISSEWDNLDYLHRLAIDLSGEIGKSELQNDLNKLQIPKYDTEIAEYDEKVFSLLEKYNLVEKYKMTKKQADNIADYLQASELLLDCLANASVSDREGIKERLLLPPV